MTKLFAHIIIAAAVAGVAHVSGCERHGHDEGPRKSAFAQEEILIGLIPEQNIFKQRERYLSLGAYLSRKLGVKVSFTSLSKYGDIVERFVSEKMDGAFFGSFTYAVAHQRLGLEALARPVNMDGTSTYHGYIFARKDKGIRHFSDFKGKRIAFVDYATTAGYLFPLAYLREHGVYEPGDFFSKVIFTGSHDSAVAAVLNNEADVGAAKNTIYDDLAEKDMRIARDLVIIAASRPVPQNCLAVRKDLDPNLKQAIKDVLLAMDKDPDAAGVLDQFGARGFVETTDADYVHVYELAKRVGMDLKRYRYSDR